MPFLEKIEVLLRETVINFAKFIKAKHSKKKRLTFFVTPLIDLVELARIELAAS
jgi:hypothetical protein